MKKWIVLNKEKIVSFSVAIFLIGFCFVHLRLVSNTFYIDKNSSFHSTTEGYGDVPLHLTQISKFAFSSSFDTADPIYYGVKMNYHFFLNFFRGLILSITDSWTVAVLWPLYILVIASVFLVFYIYRSLLKSRYLAILSLLIFYLGPSLAWYDAFATRQDFFLTKFDAVYPFQNVDFGAPLILCLIHQHTFIFGLALFLLFIYGLIKIEKNGNLRTVILAMVTLGILPLSHVHSFISASVVFFVVILMNIFEKNYEQLKKLAVVGAGAFIIIVPQLLYLWGSSREHFAKFRLGWMLEKGIGAVNFPGSDRSIFSLPYLNFIWTNFGIILPLFVLAIIFLIYYFKKQNFDKKKSLKFLLVFGLCAVILFALVQLIQFQPWDNDNNKILVFFLFLASPVVVWFLSQIFLARSFVRHSIIVLVVIFAILTGLLDLFGLLMVKKDNLPVIFNKDAQNLALYIRNNIPEDKLILTGTTHLNLVSSLAGRAVLVGYPGWLWTRGIDYGERLKLVEDFYRNPRTKADIFESYPISYVLFNEHIEYDYKISKAVLDNLFKKIYESGNYVLYSLDK